MSVDAFGRPLPPDDVAERRRNGYSIDNPLCDVDGCLDPAAVALTIADIMGHTHVCATHERIDREFTDVRSSWPLPCPVCAAEPVHFIYDKTPPEMDPNA